MKEQEEVLVFECKVRLRDNKERELGLAAEGGCAV